MSMMDKLIIFAFFFCFSLGLSGQVDTTAKKLTPKEKFEVEYQKRIKKKYLYGRYIPQDILDACRELSRLSDPAAIDTFKIVAEDTAVVKLHFGVGKWIKHNWGLQEGSRYSHYLRKMGLSYPDDMVRLTLLAWHRSLNDLDLDLKKYVDAMIAQRKKAWEEKMKKRQVIEVIRKDKN